MYRLFHFSNPALYNLHFLERARQCRVVAPRAPRMEDEPNDAANDVVRHRRHRPARPLNRASAARKKRTKKPFPLGSPPTVSSLLDSSRTRCPS